MKDKFKGGCQFIPYLVIRNWMFLPDEIFFYNSLFYLSYNSRYQNVFYPIWITYNFIKFKWCYGKVGTDVWSLYVNIVHNCNISRMLEHSASAGVNSSKSSQQQVHYADLVVSRYFSLRFVYEYDASNSSFSCTSLAWHISAKKNYSDLG